MSIVVHSVIVFVLLWVTFRVTGKRELSQLSAFDFILLIVLGDLVAEGVLGEDTSLTGAAIAVSTFALLTVLLSWVSFRMPQARGVFEGLPTVLMRRGKVLDEALKLERVNVEDLREAARREGFQHLEEIEWAVLEPDGAFSFFAKASSEEDSERPERPEGTEGTREP